MRQARFLWPLRAAALLLVLALLFDPVIPWPGSTESRGRWVLLDASLSMSAGAEDGADAWTRARERALERRSEGWRVVTFGDGVGLADSIPVSPEEPASRLAPALVRAAESGAREILVLSDLRIDDAVSVRAVTEDLGVAVAFEAMGDAARNAGIYAVEVEDRVDPGAAGSARVEVHGGVPGDSLRVELAEEGVVVASAVVDAPGPGLRRSLEVPLPPASGTGLRRFEARLATDADAFASDDGAVAFASVGSPSEGGVVVVSSSPDWEPRWLLPTLEGTTGLAGTGYLRAGPDRYLTMGSAADRSSPVDTAVVRRAAEGAALLVLHGLGEASDAWIWSLAARAPRLVAFVTDVAGAARLGLTTSPPRAGEWYVTEEVPASPLSGVLRPLEGADLPPLSGLLVPEGGAEWMIPLTVRLRGTGPAEGPLRLRAVAGRREAVVLARGFWRWSARPSGRDAYEALWAGVAGWLLREPTAAGAEVRPAVRVVPRGERVSWLVPVQREGGRIVVRAADERGNDIVADTPLTTAGTVFSEALEPGEYGYAVLDADGDSVAGGRFDVAAGTRDMVPAPVAPEGLAGAAGAAPGGGGGRPLRTIPWPYLMVIGLLCAEWIGRRRAGLR